MNPTLDRAALEAEVRRLAPWHHDVELPHGVRTYVPDLSKRDIERTRLPNLLKHLWPSLLAASGGSLQGKRVLDVACNAGGFSVEAARSGAEYVLGFDMVERYIEQARFLKSALDLPALDFQNFGIDELSPDVQGTFDITLCLGILYHLENPIASMKRISAVTRQTLVVDTALDPDPWYVRHPKPIWRMNVQRSAGSANQGSSTSLWRTEDAVQFTPNHRAVVEMLHFLGFPRVERLEPREPGLEKRYREGRRVTYLAHRK